MLKNLHKNVTGLHGSVTKWFLIIKLIHDTYQSFKRSLDEIERGNIDQVSAPAAEQVA